MKRTLLYLLIIPCCAQPALAQQFESDEQFERQAAQQLHGTWVQQPAKKLNTQVRQRAKQQTVRGLTGYGYRPQRGTIRSNYGWRPQRAQLMPQGYSQEMLQQRMQKLQRMQQMMGAAGGAGGAQQQQQQPNMLQMLMGGGAQQQQQQRPRQQQQQPAQPQMDRGELMKTFFGGS